MLFLCGGGVAVLSAPLARDLLAISRPKGSDTLESFLSKVAFESNLRKKLATCSNRESFFRKKKICESFHDTRARFFFESDFRKRLSKENFLVCHYLKDFYKFGLQSR